MRDNDYVINNIHTFIVESVNNNWMCGERAVVVAQSLGADGIFDALAVNKAKGDK